jgi:hypothetical protein
MFIEAPDSFFAAACLTNQNLYNGKGDRTELIKYILDFNPKTIKDLGRKLYLITCDTIGPYKVYNDNKAIASSEKLCKKSVYKLWLHCCRKNKSVSLNDLIKAFPY